MLLKSLNFAGFDVELVFVIGEAAGATASLAFVFFLVFLKSTVLLYFDDGLKLVLDTKILMDHFWVSS